MSAANLSKYIAYCEALESLVYSEDLPWDVLEFIHNIKSFAIPRLELELKNLDDIARFLDEKRLELSGLDRIKFFMLHEMPESEISQYRSILDSMIDWHYPCLDLFPGTGKLLPSVVGAEPLYIADWDNTLLEDVSQQFNTVFAEKRLMKYKISKYDMTPMPQKMFGLVYSLHWTMFENEVNLKNIAESVFNLLMPGGVYLFNYNPLDRWWGVEQYGSIKGFYGANTSKLIDHLKNIGFEIIRNNKEPGHLTYILCKKPGEIPRIKLSSALAKIIEKNVELL